jgi:predicted CopG family antitoxin
MQQLPWRIKSVYMEVESSVTRGTRSSRFKRIVISERNYLALKMLGYAGDSFNDVISKLLRIERSYQEMKKQHEEQQQQANSDNSSGLTSNPIPSTAFDERNTQQLAELLMLRKRRSNTATTLKNHTT